MVTYQDVLLLLENDTANSNEIFAMSYFTDINAPQVRGTIRGEYCTLYSEAAVVKNSDLRRAGVSQAIGHQAVREAELEYHVSKFKYNPEPGSYESIHLLEIVIKSKVDQIWST